MKKLTTLVFLLFTFLFLIPKTTLATCAPTSVGNMPCLKAIPVLCSDRLTCCSTDAECAPHGGLPSSASGTDVNCDPPGGKPGTGVATAFGCIPFGDQNAFLGFILKWAIGVGGGIAFILILVAGFQIITSQGDPKRLQAGQELLTSAIGGLILLIFSVFVLRVIGVDILGIPGFAAK